MIIDNIKDLHAANEIILSPLLINTLSLFPFSKFTYDCIINNRIEYLRQVEERIDSERYDLENDISTYVASYGELIDLPESYGITDYPDYPQKVFPFSKTQFFNTYYSNVLPSIFNNFFTYMKNTNRIIQIGSGVGKCLLIKVVPFEQNDFVALQAMDYNYSELAKLLVQATNHLAKQETDIKFLTQTIEQLYSYAENLQKKVFSLESQIINNTMHTWS